MLAGLQSDAESLFPAIRSLVPSPEELDDAEKRAMFGRVVNISGYKTEIFDMHDPKRVAAYNKRMLDLSRRAQVGTVRILVHDRQVMSRKDGSTGWFGYLEWMEYKRGEDGSTPRAVRASKGGQQ